MKCENCGTEPAGVSTVKFWMEYHVGGYPSDDRFLLCPDCRRDDSLDPKDMLAVEEIPKVNSEVE